MSSSSTTRIEIFENRTELYFTDYRSLHRSDRDESMFVRLGTRKEKITDEQKQILTSLYTTINYSDNTVKVASAIPKQNDSILPEPHNLAYFETKISEREPTDIEQEVYEDSFMDCPTPVYNITLPPLEDFNNPLKNAKFTLPLRNEAELETVAKKLQQNVEYGKWLYQKVWRAGRKTNLLPEWNPKTDAVNSDEVKGSAKQKYYTSKEIWKDILGTNYSEWYAARLFVIGQTEHKLRPDEIVALEILEQSENETYCQFCGCIDTKTEFLTIENKLEKEKRVCEMCAEHRSEFADEAILQAKREN